MVNALEVFRLKQDVFVLTDLYRKIGWGWKDLVPIEGRDNLSGLKIFPGEQRATAIGGISTFLSHIGLRIYYDGFRFVKNHRRVVL